MSNQLPHPLHFSSKSTYASNLYSITTYFPYIHFLLITHYPSNILLSVNANRAEERGSRPATPVSENIMLQNKVH